MYSQNTTSVQSEPRHLNEEQITLWTSVTPWERSRAIRWFASRPMPEQVCIISDGERVILPNLQKANPEHTGDIVLRYAAFVLAIRRNGYDLARKSGSRAAKGNDFARLEDMRKGVLENLRSRKKSPLKHILLSHWGEIKSLRQKGTGFLLLSRYFSRAHNIKVSSSYLARLWQDVEG